jgi:hypothetical protein
MAKIILDIPESEFAYFKEMAILANSNMLKNNELT